MLKRSTVLGITVLSMVLTYRLIVAQAESIEGRFMPGINLAGAEFYELFLPDGSRARHGRNEFYLYPSPTYFQGYDPGYFIRKGMSSVRLPFRWERLQQEPGGELDKAELDRLVTTVRQLTKLGAWVVLDLHNYMRYEGKVLGQGKASVEDFVDVWIKLSRVFSDNRNVAFGLMNEPYDVDTALWVDAANRAIDGIRQTGARHYILVGGNGFSSTQAWYDDNDGESNAVAMLRITDPLDRVIFEGHTYFDRNSSGQNDACVSPSIGVERLKPFTRWLREHNKRGYLGEFGASSQATCLEALGNVARYMLENRDVYTGWAYWAGGPKWPDDWPYLLEPNADGSDKPQMKALEPYLSR